MPASPTLAADSGGVVENCSSMYSVFSDAPDACGQVPCDLDELAATLDSAESLWGGTGGAGGAGGGELEMVTGGACAEVAAPSSSAASSSSSSASSSEAEGDLTNVNSPDSGLPDDVMDGLVNDDFSNLDLSALWGEPAAPCARRDVLAGKAEEPFTFLNDQAMQGLENGGRPEDTIKSDCMWSSSLDFLTEGVSSVGRRRRDVSLTLSECAESLFKDLKDYDLLGGAAGTSASSTSRAGLSLGSSPGVQSMLKSYMENPDDEEEEIDVVSDCDSRSTSSSTISAASYKHQFGKGGKVVVVSRSGERRTVRAGESLLRSNRMMAQQQQQQQAKQQQQQQQQQQLQQQQQQVSKQTILDSMNADHCYFATAEPQPQQQQQQQPPSAANNTEGLLTPNESSDDEDQNNSKTMTASRTCAIPGSIQQRRKLAEAMNNLKQQQQQQHGRQHHHQLSKPKFTFTLTVSNKSQDDENMPPSSQESRKRRSSALKNHHCPSPQKTTHAAAFSASSTIRPTAPSMPPAAKARRTSSAASSTSSSLLTSSAFGEREGESQKSRDIRDLHNSMERARRVDLRHNFDALRRRVPEIEHLEKASKLTILNKSSSYVRSLDAEADGLAAERERHAERNAQLRRQLQHLMGEFNSSSSSSSSSSTGAGVGRRRPPGGSSSVVTTASGRISVPKAPGSRHYY